MARGFTFLFWGLIFIFVDVRIDRFEIAPDFIGYALIALGAHFLWQYTRDFRKAQYIALALIPFSLLAFARPPPVPQVLAIPEAVLSFVMVWILIGALITFSEERDRPVFADYMRICRRFYAGIAVFAFFLDQAARFEPEKAGEFLHFVAMASVVLLGFILWVLYAMKQEFTSGSAVTSH